MQELSLETAGEKFHVRFPEGAPMGRDAFFNFCRTNRDLRIERDAGGNIIIMSPAATETGGRNAALTAQLYFWAKQNGTGKSFDSNTGFELPNGAIRSPDAAWMTLAKWNGVPLQERQRFARVCPDFVIELRSKSDRLNLLEDKLREYTAQGARLGFLIDPVENKVHVYRPNTQPQILEKPGTISGEPEMPGLLLDLADVW